MPNWILCITVCSQAIAEEPVLVQKIFGVRIGKKHRCQTLRQNLAIAG